MEPPRKIRKTEDHELKAMIDVIQDMFFNKLQSIEEKIKKISSKYDMLEKKVDMIILNIQNNSLPTLDFPDGSWLGDPNNPDLRLRCSIAPKDLEYINEHCTSAEKMSLMLLDYLFSREVQAFSNISGLGKYKKKQLDPYKIHAIKCHLMYKFGISESDWDRIKLHIDSKCRTAFRRKEKGLPVNIRGKKGRPFYQIARESDDDNDDDDDDYNLKSVNWDDMFNESNEIECDEKNSLSKEEGPEQNESATFPISTNLEEKQNEQNESSSSFTLKFDEENSLSEEEESEQNESASTFTTISTNSEPIDLEQRRFTIIQATEEEMEMLKQDPSIEIIEELPD